MAEEKSRDWFDRRLWYLEERASRVLPVIQHGLSAERYAVDFSLLTIKTGALLNGGALIALPAFGAFFKLSLFAESQGLFNGGVAFSVGLLFSWLAMITAYFANSNHAKTIFAIAKFEDSQAAISFSKSLGSTGQPVPDNSKEFTSDRMTAWKRSGRYHIATLVLTLLSLTAFVFGAYLGGIALIEGSVHLGHT